MALEWRCYIAETLSGLIRADVFPSKPPQFTRKINDKGSWTISCQVDDPNNAAVDLHTFVESGKYTWVVACNGYIVQAGPVWTYQYDGTNRVLNVSGTGIQGIFDKRVTLNPDGQGKVTRKKWDLTYQDLTLRGIVADLVRDNLAQDGAALPIMIPDDAIDEEGDEERDYLGYDMKMVWSNLDDLFQSDGGPEVDFAPQFSADQMSISWLMNIGSPTLGDSTETATITWDYGTVVQEITVDVNGSSGPIERVWAKGSGSDRDAKFGYAEDTSYLALGYPLLDYVDTGHTGEDKKKHLNAFAAADLDSFAAPLEKWTTTIVIDPDVVPGSVDVSPALGNWSLGDAPVFFVQGHPWLTSGAYRRRVTGYSDNGSTNPSTVALELNETMLDG